MIRLATVLLVALALAPTAAARTILAVFSHPDDETTVSGLLARYAKAGHDVWLISITSGQLGVTPNTKLSGAALGAEREDELRCSAHSLGIRPPILFGMQDQGISTPQSMDQAAARIRQLIDEKRPDVVITWGPDGLSGHPDHRTTSALVTQVFQQRGALRHKPSKLYYVAFPESRFVKPPKPFDQAPLRTTADEFVTTVVDTTATMDAAARSIECHKTQWNPERMSQMQSLGREVLSGKTWLRLALSDSPPAPGGRESDIFTGIR